MKRSLKLRHWKRYKDIGLLALRYGDSEFAQEFGSEEPWKSSTKAKDEDKHENNGKPVRLADELERMGPTFVKLGQVLSSRVDILK